jgi:hypothetical protein
VSDWSECIGYTSTIYRVTAVSATKYFVDLAYKLAAWVPPQRSEHLNSSKLGARAETPRLFQPCF